MMLDSSIPLMAKGIDGLKMLEDGSQIAQLWQNQKTDGELNRLYKETNGDLNKMLEIGKTSPLARFVIPQLQAQQAAQQKAALDQQKIEAEIGKTQSETGQNNATTQEKKLSNAQTLLTAANQALYVATQSGDANAVKLALNNAKTVGRLDEATYNQYFSIAESLSTKPEELKRFALDLQKAYARDPEKYNSPTAGETLASETSIQTNELTNRTSRENNENTVAGQKYGVDQNVKLGQGRIAQDDRQLEYQKYIDQNKPLDYFTAADGTRYAVYAGGKGLPVSTPQGDQIKVAQKGGTAKLSDKALVQVNEASTQLSQAEQSYKNVGNLVLALKSGKLDLSASNIVGSKARSALGLTNENDLAINKFQTTLNQAANDVLMAAKGTQTDGDAKRAVETIIANPPRDNQSAMQALNKLAAIQRNTINALNGNINTIYDNYGITRPNAAKSNPKPSTQPLSGAQNQGFQSLVEKHTR
jgi:hypothetical protein